jgi:hypothetical protein
MTLADDVRMTKLFASMTAEEADEFRHACSEIAKAIEQWGEVVIYMEKGAMYVRPATDTDRESGKAIH